MAQRADKIRGDAKLFVDFTRTDDEARMVYGYATTESLDSYETVIDLGSVEKCLPDYLKWRNVREMHQPSAVGTADEITLDEKGLYVGVHVEDDQAWRKVKSGVYKGFSIGGKRDYQVGNRIFIKRINEITLGDRPSNEDCTFDTFRIFQTEEAEDMRILTAEAKAAIEATITRLAVERPQDDDIRRYAGEEVYDASRAMYALSSVTDLFMSEAGEVEPNADQVAALLTVIQNLKVFIASEIMENNLVTYQATPVEVPGEVMTDIELTAAPGDVERIGAALSKKNVERVQAMHDHAADMGACCKGAGKTAGKTTRIAAGGDKVLIVGNDQDENVVRISGLLGAAGMVFEITTDDVERIAGLGADSIFRVDGLDMEIPGIEGAKTVIKTLVERLVPLEAAPAPAKGVVKVVGKEQDVDRIDAGKEEKVEAATDPKDAILRIHQGGGIVRI